MEETEGLFFAQFLSQKNEAVIRGDFVVFGLLRGGNECGVEGRVAQKFHHGHLRIVNDAFNAIARLAIGWLPHFPEKLFEAGDMFFGLAAMITASEPEER